MTTPRTSILSVSTPGHCRPSRPLRPTLPAGCPRADRGSDRCRRGCHPRVALVLGCRSRCHVEDRCSRPVRGALVPQPVGWAVGIVGSGVGGVEWLSSRLPVVDVLGRGQDNGSGRVGHPHHRASRTARRSSDRAAVRLQPSNRPRFPSRQQRQEPGRDHHQAAPSTTPSRAPTSWPSSRCADIPR